MLSVQRGEVVDGVDAQGLDVPHVVGGHFGGQIGHRHLSGVGFGDQFVVHVGDVDDQSDLVAAIDQISLYCVENDRTDHVSNVARFIDGRATKIYADFARLHGLERFFVFDSVLYTRIMWEKSQNG